MFRKFVFLVERVDLILTEFQALCTVSGIPDEDEDADEDDSIFQSGEFMFK